MTMNTVSNRFLVLFLFFLWFSDVWCQRDEDGFLTGPPDSVLLSAYSGSSYLRTIVPLVASSDKGASSLTSDQLLVDVDFLDGFGRGSYSVGVRRSPSGKDLVSFNEHDLLDRRVRSWLAVPVPNAGGDLSEQAFVSYVSDYYDDSRPYHETTYESCLDEFLTGEYGPGDDWQGKYVQRDYLVNAPSSGASCLNYQVVGNSLTCVGTYPANELFLERRRDEDGRMVFHFTDRLGRLILERKFNEGISHDTYFVYDDYHELRYVLPPLASEALSSSGVRWSYDSTVALKEYGYYYQYDTRGHCIIRQLPGCAPVYQVYDRSGRLVLSQDGNQREEDAWIVNKYDKLGRLLYVCQVKVSTPFESLLSEFKDLVVVESFSTDTQPYPAGDTGYSRGFYHLAPMELLIVNYYDDYRYLDLLPQNVSSELSFKGQLGYGPRHPEAGGLLTGTRVYLSGHPLEYLTTSYYYDKQGNVVQERSSNHLGGYERHFYTYTFSGKVLKHLHQHVGRSGNVIPESYEYTYDRSERLLRTSYALQSTFRHLLSEHSYDDLGRLKSKSLNGRKETVSCDYNLRDWITGVTSPSFREFLYYDDHGNYGGGDILRMEWRAGSEAFTRCYNFRYDD